MSPKKAVPDALLASLHGKGSMSEVLRIERQRLMEQAAEDMRAQFGPAAAPAAAPVSAPAPAPPAPAVTAVTAVTSIHPEAPPTHKPSEIAREGLSKFSRFVGDDLSEFGGIMVHTEQTVAAAPEWPKDSYYVDVHNTLPFSSQRQLLNSICRLTLGYESFSCRITLDLLSTASGIRNPKTLRKWLADLQKKRCIRYVPIHGDLRGSVIEVTPPEEIRGSIERSWRSTRRKA